MDELHLRQVRDAELQLVLPLLRPHARLLEVGAGSGWQAHRLAALGFIVSAVDIHVAAETFWDVRQYDGRILPYPDGSFDHVFSSNALEHVDDLSQVLAEIRRVLRPGGTSIHLVPTASWRFWTSLAHYPHMLRQAARRLSGRAVVRAQHAGHSAAAASPRLRDVLIAERHGAHHSMLWELRGFAAGHWKKLLTSRGDSLVSIAASGIYYSGYGLLASVLGMRARKRLSHVLGSSCHLVVLAHHAPAASTH